MADIKEMREFVDRLEKSGVNDVFMERKELAALIACAEALEATTCGRSYSFHEPVMDCPHCAALDQLRRAP